MERAFVFSFMEPLLLRCVIPAAESAAKGFGCQHSGDRGAAEWPSLIANLMTELHRQRRD